MAIKKNKTLKKNKKSDTASELRMDLVSNDWVVIATGRARRPESFAQHKRNMEVVSPNDCPFCQESLKNDALFKSYRSDGSVAAMSVPNKYPAFTPRKSLNERKEGPNRIMDGYGFHEVIVTDDHDKQMALFNQEEIKRVIDVYQARYLVLMNQEFIRYVSIFHNHGQEAGASVAHPHSQIIAIPIIDPGLRGSILGAEAFYTSQGKCVYCTMIEWDRKDGRRIIYENEKFVVLCPFSPQVSFEIRIYPKTHQSNFEQISGKEKGLFADALRAALYKIFQALKDPAYNFYIHTAPCDGASHDYYHWHVNIMPKTAIWAGFELGTGVEISTIEPEVAAEFLRKF